MSNLLKVLGIVLGVAIILSGFAVISEFSESDFSFILGIILIVQGAFQCCFSLIVANTYDKAKEIKDNNLSYIEELIIYTKNQVKEISAKVDKISGNYEEE